MKQDSICELIKQSLNPQQKESQFLRTYWTYEIHDVRSQHFENDVTATVIVFAFINTELGEKESKNNQGPYPTY